MAAIEQNQNDLNKKKNYKNFKKSLNIDMTPMVDLGFLLITFFIFTTSLSQPKAMDLIVPSNGKPMPVTKKGILNLILDKEKVYYYDSDEIQNINQTDYNKIRKIIINKQQQAYKNNLDNKFMILIKPTEKSSYKQTVDLLDEMQINQIVRYSLSEPSNQEINKIENYIN